MVNNMNSISWQSAKDYLNNPYYKIIDIREQNEYYQSHLAKSINIPYLQLLNNFERILSKNYIYFIICTKGKTSLDLVKILNAKGFKAYSINGGFNVIKQDLIS